MSRDFINYPHRPIYGLIPELGPQWIIRMYSHPHRSQLLEGYRLRSCSAAFKRTLRAHNAQTTENT